MLAHNTATPIVLMLVVQAPTVQIADTHAKVDTIITDAREGQDPAPALEAIEVLRESLTQGKTLSRKSEERLLAMIVDPQGNGVIQFKAFALLCDNVTDENAEQVLTLVLSWIRQIRSIRYVGDPALVWPSSRVQHFLEHGARNVAAHLKDPVRLLDLYVDILQGPQSRFNEWTWIPCYERIADNPSPLSVRQRYMLDVMEYVRGWAPEAFIPLVTDDIVPDLRKIAFDGPPGPTGYHIAAVELLVEHADLETGRRLRSLAAEQGVDSEIVTAPGSYVWRIESQHQPDMLLEHLRLKTQNKRRLRSQLWALQHAIKLGVDKEKLRSALLEYTRNLGPETKHDGFAARIKDLAVMNGLLTSDEFPVFPETELDRVIMRMRRAGGLEPPQE